MGFGLGGIAGGLLSADAAGDGADAMQAAAQQGIDTVKGYETRTRSDTSPYRQLGASSTNMLSYLMGLSPSKSGGLYSIAEDGRYVANPTLYATDSNYKAAWDAAQKAYKAKHGSNFDAKTGEQGVLKYLSKAGYDITGGGTADAQDSQYGSLLRGFTQEDLNNDVVYNTGLQFGLDQGNKQLNNRALAGGAYDSGSTLKALTKWANDYGTTKAEGAYNRFNTDKNSKYSMLTGASNIGQNAVNTSASSGQAAGTSISELLGQGANAYAAGRMGEAQGYGQAIEGLSSLAGLFI